MSPGAAAAELQLSVADEQLRAALEAAELDLLSITRARAITFDAPPNDRGLPAERVVVYVEA